MAVTTLAGGPGGIEAMKPPRVRWNTTEVRVERFVRLAQRLELPVFGFEVRGRDVIVLTRPREDGAAAPPAGGRSRRSLVPRERRRRPQSVQQRKKP